MPEHPTVVSLDDVNLTPRHSLGDKVFRPNMLAPGCCEQVEIFRIKIERAGVYYQTDERGIDGKQEWFFHHEKDYYDTPHGALEYLRDLHADMVVKARERIDSSEASLVKIQQALDAWEKRNG